MKERPKFGHVVTTWIHCVVYTGVNRVLGSGQGERRKQCAHPEMERV